MANPWFRMYAEFSHDPKVQMLSESMQRRYVMLMCMRCSNDIVTLHETEIAFHMRITDVELAETKQLFINKGFIDNDWNLLNWEKRQFISDSSSERVKRHRAKRAEQGLPQQNAIRSEVRYAVYKRDGNACIYCGKTEDLTIDHDIPQSRGGSDEIDNLLTACRACNASKRDLTHDEYCERNGFVTLQKRKVNAVDTEQIQRTEKKKNTRSSGDEQFDVFWKSYPKKVGKKDTLKMWKAAKINGEFNQIMQALESQKQSEKWKNGFILDPVRWVKGRRWEDEVQATPQQFDYNLLKD